MFKKFFFNGEETNYSISDLGEVRNDKTGKFLKIANGRVQTTINGKHKSFSMGKIVAETFLENPNNCEYAYHKDGDKNNNKVENLEWISKEENGKRTWKKRRENGTTRAGEKRKPYKKRENIVENCKYKLNTDEKQIILDGELVPYGINVHGQVRNLKTGYLLKGSILHSYRYINFRWEGKQKNKAVHRLVAEAFLPNPNNLPIVDHIDGDRLNNDISNLRWVTEKENANNKHLDRTPKKPEFKEILYSEEELKNEQWKNFQGYKVSNLGRIKGKSGKILKGSAQMSGYIGYTINNRRYLGHILVWLAFKGEKKNKNVINHIDGNKHNNRLSNLEEVTHQENLQKAADETDAWNFIKVGEYDDNGNLLRIFANASAAAREIGIQPGSMRNTIRRNGKCYNNLFYRYIK